MTRPTNIATWKVALLLFGSGLCALIYQMVWLREFRLIFGASTAASAAVLAIFMGGLGLGSLLLGHRADTKEHPLKFYGNLELIIAVTAALTPLLLWVVSKAYIATGGSPVLGLWGATAARLVLAALVLVLPTFLMGGTLPAAARSVEHDEDLGRRNLALLYGANTLGAVTGSALATFALVELFGNRKTLWAACLVNVLIALVARRVSDTHAAQTPAAPAKPEAPVAPVAPAKAGRGRPALDMAAGEEAPVPAMFVLVSAAVVGFAFLLMELVWYRMLSPILGGSTYTFGLILIVALFGIGLGGAAYAVLRANRPATLTGFAFTCALEAAFIALPFALGDHLALLAMLLRSLGSLGFWGLVMGWSIITMIVVLPAAFMAGVQFPLLIALLGRGREAVGRHIGLAYTYNTIGAILGSLAGGFGLLPLLTAVNAWRAVVVVLALLAAASLALAALAGRRAGAAAGETGAATASGVPQYLLARMATPAAAAVAALLLILADGPTDVWRHGSIGAGRSDRFNTNPNILRAYMNETRRNIAHEWEGVESSVALGEAFGYAFYVNGKADGHIRQDAGTQVMSGLVGALVHPNPRTAMIIGLGTGSTAGWLGAVPDIERVDVVELEPAILEVARMCAPGNQDVMNNPKVRVGIGDAREALLTTPEKYDLIFSEPSNPYRAGIASLYTKDFYEACTGRLKPGGLFLQWLQAYEVDGQTVRTVYATLGSVFPSIETWRTQAGDLLLMASLEPIRIDVAQVRERIARQPFHAAITKIWRVTDAEGVLSRHIANSDFARAIVKAENGRVNTDDLNEVEFAFARSVGRSRNFGPASVQSLAAARGESRPDVTGGEVDWFAVEDRRVSSWAGEGNEPPMTSPRPDEPEPMRHVRTRAAAMTQLLRGNRAAAIEVWERQPQAPQDLTQVMYVGSAYADAGNEAATMPLIETLRRYQPVEADALLAQLRWRQKQPVAAVEALEACFLGCRRDPWAQTDLIRRIHTLAAEVVRVDASGEAGKRLYSAMGQPYVMMLLNDDRMRTVAQIATFVDQKTGSRLAAEAFSRFEPHPPWDVPFLSARVRAYVLANHPLTTRAAEDLDTFRTNEPFPFDFELAPQPVPPGAATRATAGPAAPATAPAAPPPEESLLRLPPIPGVGPAADPGRGADTGGGPPAEQQPPPSGEGGRGGR